MIEPPSAVGHDAHLAVLLFLNNYQITSCGFPGHPFDQIKKAFIRSGGRRVLHVARRPASPFESTPSRRLDCLPDAD